MKNTNLPKDDNINDWLCEIGSYTQTYKLKTNVISIHGARIEVGEARIWQLIGTVKFIGIMHITDNVVLEVVCGKSLREMIKDSTLVNAE